MRKKRALPDGLVNATYPTHCYPSSVGVVPEGARSGPLGERRPANWRASELRDELATIRTCNLAVSLC